MMSLVNPLICASHLSELHGFSHNTLLWGAATFPKKSKPKINQYFYQLKVQVFLNFLMLSLAW